MTSSPAVAAFLRPFGSKRPQVKRPTCGRLSVVFPLLNPALTGRGRGGVSNFFRRENTDDNRFAEDIRDPNPTPASPHRRFAPQLLRPPSLRSPIAPSSRLPRNCLEGRGAATAGEILGQLLYCCLKKCLKLAFSFQLFGQYKEKPYLCTDSSWHAS